MSEIKVKYRFIKTSPRKIRQVIDLIRGKKVDWALHQLKFSLKAAAVPVTELLRSGIASAKEKDMDEDNLYIKEIRADEGPRLKRRRLISRGRAVLIRKRMTHLSLVLADKSEPKNQSIKAKTKTANKQINSKTK